MIDFGRGTTDFPLGVHWVYERTWQVNMLKVSTVLDQIRPSPSMFNKATAVVF